VIVSIGSISNERANLEGQPRLWVFKSFLRNIMEEKDLAENGTQSFCEIKISASK